MTSHNGTTGNNEKNSEKIVEKMCSHCWLNARCDGLGFFLVSSGTVACTMNYIRNYISSKVTEFGFYEHILRSCLLVAYSTHSLSHKWQRTVHVPFKQAAYAVQVNGCSQPAKHNKYFTHS